MLGFEEGLRAWHRFVKPGGFVVVSELSWLTETPAPVARAFWDEAYPTMGTIGSNSDAARDAGYDVIATTILPREDWEVDYYVPMRLKLEEMRRQYGPLPAFDEMEKEIAVFDMNDGDYSYVFYVLKRR